MHSYLLNTLAERFDALTVFCSVGFPVLLAFGIYVGAKGIGRKDVAAFITLVFLVTNILYVSLCS